MMATSRDNKTGAISELPITELEGRTVWSSSGERLGVLKHATSDTNGKLVGLEVQKRWFMGPTLMFRADDMKLVDGEIIVSDHALSNHDGAGDLRSVNPAAGSSAAGSHAVGLSSAGTSPAGSRPLSQVRSSERSTNVTPSSAPPQYQSLERSRPWYMGVDLLGSLLGAFVAFSIMIIVGALLIGLYNSSAARLDLGLTSWSALASTSLFLGAVTVFIAALIGGWAAARASYSDGVTNGLMVVPWLVVIALISGGLGAWAGDRYDVIANVDVMPQLTSTQVGFVGFVAVVFLLALMLLGGAIGGMVGQMWRERMFYASRGSSLHTPRGRDSFSG